MVWSKSIFEGFLPRVTETIEEIFPKPNNIHENQKISDTSELELNSMDISELYAMLSDIANEETGSYTLKLSLDLIINFTVH